MPDLMSLYARHELALTVVGLVLSVALLAHAAWYWRQRRRYGGGSVLVGVLFAMWAAAATPSLAVRVLGVAVVFVWVIGATYLNPKARKAAHE